MPGKSEKFNRISSKHHLNLRNSKWTEKLFVERKKNNKQRLFAEVEYAVTLQIRKIEEKMPRTTKNMCRFKRNQSRKRKRERERA